MKKALLFIVKSIVDNPDKVEVSEENSEGVLNLIERVAKDYPAGKYSAKPTDEVVADEKALTQLFERFMPKELEQIASGNKDVVEHFKKHYPKDDEQPGEKYLRITTGIVSTYVLETIPAGLKALGARLYDNLLQTSGNDRVTIRLKLQKSNELPDWRNISYLLSEEVTESRNLSIRPRAIDYELAENSLSTVIYPTFSTAAKVEKLPDLTEEMKISIAASTLAKTITCLEQTIPSQMIIVNSPEQLDALFGEIESDKKGRKKQQ